MVEFGQKTVGVAILSAGASSRLGQPKQLVPFRGKPLLQHTIDEAGKIEFTKKWVILGAYQKNIKEQVDFNDFQLISNPNWEEGMASSVCLAAMKAQQDGLDGLLITLSDQPFVSSELLGQLLRLYQPGRESIVSSEYGGTLGVPALFDGFYYQELTKLSGDAGARKLINTFRTKVKSVNFERGSLDIDTPKDLKRLNMIEDAHNN